MYAFKNISFFHKTPDFSVNSLSLFGIQMQPKVNHTHLQISDTEKLSSEFKIIVVDPLFSKAHYPSYCFTVLTDIRD